MNLMEYITDWLYQMVVGVFSELFTAINTLGSDLFGQPWVQQIVALFSNLGWVLFVVGIVVALFEFAIESQSGRGDPKTLSLNIIKGFFAVNLFSVVPVQLYSLAVNMQRNMSWLMSWTVVPEGNGNLALECLEVIENALFGPILAIIIIFMFGYAVVKVFLSGLKRGGILLIQVAVGSLYMFSVPRGFTDGFIMWIKQVIALCMTTFLQSVMMVCGLILFKDQWLMGLGVMLAAGEIPRIAGMFGLETAARPNINGVINTAQSAVHLTQMIRTVAK